MTGSYTDPYKTPCENLSADQAGGQQVQPIKNITLKTDLLAVLKALYTAKQPFLWCYTDPYNHCST